ncbi:MAG TPA: aldehyde ferredoxin oxidoreductase family protein [Candidatus Hydrogenedentes bacterium]|nr:aldehyde ferredoxin oxidoreductase family protein [Candidatus Hydrogenedentota bacterium]HPG66741.1 aldehyde ferredoxin oxidoreductase family protein [Candidatus Hydrogenedentota bacterium]
MSVKGGYFRKRLHVNLSSGTTRVIELDEDFLERYIGGRGFGAKLVWENLKQHDFRIDPFGPENLLVVAPGPLTGAYLPSSGKNSFVSISPATGLYGDSSMGGGFAVELRQAGLDCLTIEGIAPELSLLFIDNGEARIIPMPQLRGKSCLETEGMVETRIGTHDIHVVTIGVAGENRVRFACANTDWSRNAGRTGIGAIMGSKNLKAIAVRGHKDLPVYDLDGLIAETNKAVQYMRGHKYFRFWQQQGLMNVIEYANDKGILPTWNFRDTVFPNHDKINGEVMLDRYKIGDSACFMCPMCCSNINLVKDGKYRGVVTEGPEYETCAMLGSNLGIDDFAAILAATQLCDELGVDTISTGNIVGAVIEGYERGIIGLEDLDGREIRWNDPDAVLELIGKIGRREGIGDILADGAKRIIQQWPEMDKVILHVKGLEQSAYDSRAGASMGLAYATCDIGAHHTRAWTIAREMEEGANWTNEDRVKIVVYHQTLRPLFDMLGVCRLPWIELGLNERHYAYFYTHITGKEATLEELLELSRRVYDMTRRMNVRLGATRKDDSLPYKVRECPVLSGPNAGKVLREDVFQDMLSAYYAKRGWNEDGVPPVELEATF